MVSIIASKLRVKDGETVELTCTVPDFLNNIVILQNNNNRAVQLAGEEFQEVETKYKVIRSGPAEITFRILRFSKSRDEGSWVIRYGTNTSTPVTLSAFLGITASTDFVKDGESVVLTCTVPDFSKRIVIKHDGDSIAVCASPSCQTDINEYTVERLGTNVVTLTIDSFLSTRDAGSWSVIYDFDISETIALFPKTCTAAEESPDIAAAGIAVAGEFAAGIAFSNVIAPVFVVGNIAAAVYKTIKYCTTKNEETIHVEKGTHVTLGHEIPNAGKAVWKKSGKTFEDYHTEHVEINGTMVHFHEALPTDCGSYVCTYGDNSETLKYDLTVKELEKKDSADSFRPHHNSLPPLKVTTEQE